MKFKGHETYYIRSNWLSKGMRYVVAYPDVFVTKDENRAPMDMLGIGKNMVKSLRYWMKATGLAQEATKGERIQTLTEFGKIVFENDRYLEEMGTLWLLHYKLAINKDEATAWYFFFNEFKMQEFTKEDFIRSLDVYTGKTVALRSLEDDFNCIIKTYTSDKGKMKSPEENKKCPLSDLRLVELIDSHKKLYNKNIKIAQDLDPYIVFAVICDQANGKTEIPIQDLRMKECNIGRVFNLRMDALIDLLYKIRQEGLIKVVRTAGLDYIEIREKLSFNECVERYYSNLNV